MGFGLVPRRACFKKLSKRLLIEEILHQLVGFFIMSHFIHPRWLAGFLCNHAPTLGAWLLANGLQSFAQLLATNAEFCIGSLRGRPLDARPWVGLPTMDLCTTDRREADRHTSTATCRAKKCSSFVPLQCSFILLSHQRKERELPPTTLGLRRPWRLCIWHRGLRICFTQSPHDVPFCTENKASWRCEVCAPVPCPVEKCLRTEHGTWHCSVVLPDAWSNWGSLLFHFT